MISRNEYLKSLAIDVLDERVERAVIALGQIVPDANMTTFQGDQLSIQKLVKEESLMLAFMRASW